MSKGKSVSAQAQGNWRRLTRRAILLLRARALLTAASAVCRHFPKKGGELSDEPKPPPRQCRARWASRRSVVAAVVVFAGWWLGRGTQNG